MNKLEELEKQYAKLGEEIEKLKKGKEKYFIPKGGQDYWFLDCTGIAGDNFAGWEDEDKIFERQIPLKTEEEAKFYDQKRIYETDYKKYLLDREEEPINWKDVNQDMLMIK